MLKKTLLSIPLMLLMFVAFTGCNQQTSTSVTDSPVTSAQKPGSSSGKITFMSGRDGNMEIYVMNADGSNQTPLTSNTVKSVASVWSPDGSKIAFMSEKDGNLEIYLMNADGSGQTRFTNDEAVDADPTWSPDGSKIAFAHRDDSLEIYVMNADGSNRTRLTENEDVDGYPDWSR